MVICPIEHNLHVTCKQLEELLHDSGVESTFAWDKLSTLHMLCNIDNLGFCVIKFCDKVSDIVMFAGLWSVNPALAFFKVGVLDTVKDFLMIDIPHKIISRAKDRLFIQQAPQCFLKDNMKQLKESERRLYGVFHLMEELIKLDLINAFRYLCGLTFKTT